jgi:TonB family protein
MTTACYNYPELPWAVLDEERHRLRRIGTRVAIIALVFSVLIPLLPVPEQEIEKIEQIPPRLAKLLLERQRQPVPEAKTPQAKKLEKKKKIAKKKKRIANARKRASRTGLLALQQDLAELRDDSVVASALGNKSLRNSGSKAKRTSRSIISTNLGKGSSGIQTSQYSRSTGGSGLSGRSTTRVKSSIRGTGGGLRSVAGGRPLEELRLVFDKNKRAIYTLYNRALRKDPGLQGKVVLELTISSSGRVTACRVVSSEINSPEMVRKLVARVKLFNFGAKNVGIMRVNYPIDFFPS